MHRDTTAQPGCTFLCWFHQMFFIKRFESDVFCLKGRYTDFSYCPYKIEKYVYNNMYVYVFVIAIMHHAMFV